MNYPKLFTDIPRITPSLLKKLEKQGLIVAPTTLHKGSRRIADVANPTAGQVVGYSILAKKLASGQINQMTARVLLTLETAREGGPRETHKKRLLQASFAGNKREVLEKVEKWVKKAK